MNKLIKSIPLSLIQEIPPPILWDILLRLPTKTCLNCKLVCKDWYLIIISPEFGASRSSSSPCPSFSTILLYGSYSNIKKNFLLLDLDKFSKVDDMGNLIVSSEAMISFKTKFRIPRNRLYVINECNGLVCFMYGLRNPVIIINLLTGQEVIIEQVCKPYFRVRIFGLGCCPVTSQYKVVRIMSRLDKGKAHVCTMGTNEWRAIGSAPGCVFSVASAFLHGSLHRYSFSENCIWSFHFGNEQFSLIPMPDVMKTPGGGGGGGRVGVIESCLSFSRGLFEDDDCEIWVMKEYGKKDSWVKMFALSTDLSKSRMPMLVSYAGSFNLRIYDNIDTGNSQGEIDLEVYYANAMTCNVKFSKF